MSRAYQEHPELFPWVEDMARQIEIDYNPKFNAWLHEQEKLQAQCNCEYDGGYGDDGSITKRFARFGCPTHGKDDLDEGVIFCPNCGWESSFTEHYAVSRELGGETQDEEWLTCNRCGKETDAAELERTNKEA
jgi:ribosomal protein L37E